MKRSDAAKFFERHGIMHAERVEFDLKGYRVWSYRRDAEGNYQVIGDQPIVETKFYPYEDSPESPW